jgi:small-conductance mechanosensitive channel
MTELFQNFFSDFIIFIAESRILGAIIILLLFSLLAKLVDLFIHRIINFVSKKSKIEIDDTFIGIIHRPVWISILLIGGLSAVKWVHFYSRFTFTLTATLKSLLIIVIGLTLNKLMKSICQRWCSIRRQWVEIIHFSENIGRVLLLIIGVGLLLTFWKINVTPLLASAGIAGIAIALAAKDTIANFFGGINLFMDKVEETLLDVARSNQSIAREPEPRVRFRSFGDSFLNFELLCWAKTPADRGRVIHELNRSIFSEFNKRDIKIPFPRQDIHIHSLPPNTTGKPRDL